MGAGGAPSVALIAPSLVEKQHAVGVAHLALLILKADALFFNSRVRPFRPCPRRIFR